MLHERGDRTGLLLDAPALAGRAAGALGHVGDPRATGLLLERLSTGLARNTPASALGKLGSETRAQ